MSTLPFSARGSQEATVSISASGGIRALSARGMPFFRSYFHDGAVARFPHARSLWTTSLMGISVKLALHGRPEADARRTARWRPDFQLS